MLMVAKTAVNILGVKGVHSLHFTVIVIVKPSIAALDLQIACPSSKQFGVYCPCNAQNLH